MSLSASYDTKQRVKQAVDIVELVGSYLSLRSEGHSFKALCPWHDDTRPSLHVNPERQSFKCWVCDIGGDVFSFVMKMEGVEFPEALRMLADRANIPLQPAGRGDSSGAADEKRILYQAMAWAFEQYHEHLMKSAEAAAARDYLAERRITPDAIRRFRLGFAPDSWDWTSAQLRGTAFNQAMLERVGVVSRRRQGPGYYDRFKGRVIFPIFDTQGRAVGLGGRVLPQLATPDSAKYVNSPETPLFSKSNLLYGLHIARDAIRKTGTALVMEGYTDCIAAHEAGFENTVAVLGTALGASHVQLLRRFAERVRVVLVLDGDEAGRRRAKEVLELFVAGNVDLRVLTLPEEMDPAEYLSRYGPTAFEGLVSGAADALTHACRSRTADIDLKSDVPRAMQALEEIVSIIAKAPRLRSDTSVEDRLREEKILKRLAVDFQLPEEQVRKLMTENRRKTASRPTSTAGSVAASTREPLDPLERELFEVLLHFPKIIEQIGRTIQPAQLRSEPCRRVLTQSLALWSEGILPDFERLLLENDDPGVKNLLVELDESARAKAGAEPELRLRDVLLGFERRQQQHWARGRTAALRQGQMPEEEELTVLQRLEQQQRARQQEQDERTRPGISEFTDGQDAGIG